MCLFLLLWHFSPDRNLDRNFFKIYIYTSFCWKTYRKFKHVMFCCTLDSNCMYHIMSCTLLHVSACVHRHICDICHTARKNYALANGFFLWTITHIRLLTFWSHAARDTGDINAIIFAVGMEIYFCINSYIWHLACMGHNFHLWPHSHHPHWSYSSQRCLLLKKPIELNLIPSGPKREQLTIYQKNKALILGVTSQGEML